MVENTNGKTNCLKSVVNAFPVSPRFASMRVTQYCDLNIFFIFMLTLNCVLNVLAACVYVNHVYMYMHMTCVCVCV